MYSPIYNKVFEDHIKPLIEELVPHGAGAWELYSSKPGAAEAAAELSKELQDVLESMGLAACEAMARMEKLQAFYRKLGALDTEPCGHVRRAVTRLLAYLSSEAF